MTKTANVLAFESANHASPVVSGYAIEPNPTKPSRGAVYTLENGQKFRFTAEECRQFTPRWLNV